MTAFIAMIRGINVGGRRRIPMDGLVTLFTSLGFTNVGTCVQSGNVIFSSTDSNPEDLAAKIEREILKTFDFTVRAILRSSDEMQGVVTGNPFLKEVGVNTGALHVTFLSDTPPRSLADILGSAEDGADRYVLIGKEVYLSCPDGYGRTKFSNTFFEKKLKIAATTRNWKTVIALGRITGE
jgi:uncharacterized protein (DUF1697 family)